MESKFNPSLYAENSTCQRSSSRDVLQEYRHLLTSQSDDAILDLGCGNGYVTSKFLAPNLNYNFKKIIGADISPKMIEQANNLYGDKTIKFRVMDILSDPLPEEFLEYFDHCFSFYCLQFQAETAETFRATFLNIRKLLKKRASVFAVFPGLDPFYATWKVLYSKAKYAPYMKSTWFVFPEYLDAENKSEWCSRILESAGFKINICEVLPKSFCYEDIEDALSAMNAINTYTIPEDLRAEFRADMLAELEKRGTTFQENGKTFYKIHYEVFFVHAIKQ